MKDEPRRIVVHPAALDDIKRMKHDAPEAFSDMVAALKQIASSSRPCQQSYPIDIRRSYPHLFKEGGYRVKDVNRKWRAVIRFLDADRFVLISEDEIDSQCEVIEVVFADVRSNATYSVLLARRVSAV